MDHGDNRPRLSKTKKRPLQYQKSGGSLLPNRRAEARTRANRRVNPFRKNPSSSQERAHAHWVAITPLSRGSYGSRVPPAGRRGRRGTPHSRSTSPPSPPPAWTIPSILDQRQGLALGYRGAGLQCLDHLRHFPSPCSFLMRSLRSSASTLAWHESVQRRAGLWAWLGRRSSCASGGSKPSP
jgi:hypothetical protein